MAIFNVSSVSYHDLTKISFQGIAQTAPVGFLTKRFICFLILRTEKAVKPHGKNVLLCRAITAICSVVFQ